VREAQLQVGFLEAFCRSGQSADGSGQVGQPLQPARTLGGRRGVAGPGLQRTQAQLGGAGPQQQHGGQHRADDQQEHARQEDDFCECHDMRSLTALRRGCR
jgi:hypothetical protein